MYVIALRVLLAVQVVLVGVSAAGLDHIAVIGARLAGVAFLIVLLEKHRTDKRREQ